MGNSQVIQNAARVCNDPVRKRVSQSGRSAFCIQRYGKIVFQRGYWDKRSFLRMHNLPVE